VIQVVIEMDPQTNELTIRGAAPPAIIFAIVVNAYHELLAAKMNYWNPRSSRSAATPPGRDAE
jgi:hypothetical protein